MNERYLSDLHRAAKTGESISADTAMAILDCSVDDMPRVLSAASTVRSRYFGRRAILCSIISAKCGNCSEDCSFCAQSCRSSATAETFPLRSDDEILAQRSRIARYPVSYYSIVTSGYAATPGEIEAICRTMRSTSDRSDESGSEAAGGAMPKWCASLGCLSADALRQLKEAGLVRYHHNLEGAESFFSAICTTHSYRRRIETVRAAKAVGLEVCCGGILGVGESAVQRVELAMAIAHERVDSIPLNFLVAIEGTPLAGTEPLRPLDIIRIVAMFRLMNPQAEIRIAGGREHLHRLQPLIFQAGACGIMVGDLLTVSGSDLDDDMQMLADLEMQPEG